MNASNNPAAYAEVIGDPIAQSKSPIIHNFWLEKLGAPGRYGRSHVLAGGLANYLAAARADKDWRGCNVTMPHKQAIMPLLDRIDGVAARIGAVNTVVREPDGALAGYNTDAAGFLEPLQARLVEPHLYRMARIMGAGGAARAIVVGLADAGFTLVVAARDPQKARALLDELAPNGEHHAVDIAHFAPSTDFAFDDREGLLDLVVNASPLGMTGQPPLHFDFSHAPPGSVVYDIVTDPVDTQLLQDARELGLPTIDGRAMLIGQAGAAFEKFFGASPPRQHDAELRALLAS